MDIKDVPFDMDTNPAAFLSEHVVSFLKNPLYPAYFEQNPVSKVQKLPAGHSLKQSEPSQ
tara:strand:+ start:473 stop:652 length:180 start_codon:yes stop_codon:yes gene_type:complete